MLISLLANNNPVIFLSPQTLKNLMLSIISSDNYNMLHMFNSSTDTDFRTASKHVSMLSYVIRVITRTT